MICVLIYAAALMAVSPLHGGAADGQTVFSSSSAKVLFIVILICWCYKLEWNDYHGRKLDDTVKHPVD